jgi:hypothetical protein
MNVTTQIQGRKDDHLLAEKGGRGFPYIAFLDDEGGLIAAQPGRERTVEGFQKTLAGTVQAFLDLRAKARSGDATAQIDFALLEGDLGRITFEEVQQRLGDGKLSDAQTAKLRGVEASAVLAAAVKELQTVRDEEGFLPVGKKVADAYAQGLMPDGTERRQQFLSVAFNYALATKDAALATKALDALKPVIKELAGDDPRVADWIKSQEGKIAALGEAKKEGCGDEGVEEGGGEGGK